MGSGQEEFDVVIVGCGPTGALAATLCGLAGLRTLVIDRETTPFSLPRAVHLDHEMMRIFQDCGVADRLLPKMRDTDGHLHIGADRQVIRYMGTVGKPRPFGWSGDYFFYQPELEAALRERFSGLPNVSVRLGTEFQSLQQDANGVTVTLGGTHPSQVSARWLIACDGASSPVRKFMGMRLEDLGFEEPWLVVDAEVHGPVRFPPLTGVPDTADLQRLSVMVCDPSRPATVVPGRGNHRRWEFMLLPGESDDAMMTPESVQRLVSPWLLDTPHKIIRAATYRFHGLVAERWRQGRVFLAGDAAHQTPPFFGQGMCHGLRDVANLCWKLSLVSSGKADAALLDTYQAERDPHVRAIIGAALEAGRYICLLDRDAAAARDRELLRRAAEAPTRTAGDLIPPLKSGVVLAGSAGAGERFIQPRLEDGPLPTLLDDATGGGWRLFVLQAADIAAADQLCAELAPGIPVKVIHAASIPRAAVALSDWLEVRDARAVLVRPDFYVFGTVARDESLEVALRGLTRSLHLEPATLEPVEETP
jgi:3-(3-hydroxy-phenyl)propionate hydroxylase